MLIEAAAKCVPHATRLTAATDNHRSIGRDSLLKRDNIYVTGARKESKAKSFKKKRAGKGLIGSLNRL